MGTNRPRKMLTLDLPHFPSTETLRPSDCPLQPDAVQYAAETGSANLQLIYALAEKEQIFAHHGRDRSMEPFTAVEIIQLLNNQAQRRRKQIFDDQIAQDPREGAAFRKLRRLRERITYGKNSLANTPLAEIEHDLPWSKLDEDELNVAAHGERGDHDYTGRVDRRLEEQTLTQLERFFIFGELPHRDNTTLVFLNALFGTLHVIHVLELNEAHARDWKANLPMNAPMNAEELIQAVKDLRLEHGIAPGRTKITDLVVCGKTLPPSPSPTNHWEHVTDTLQNTADNAHEDEILPFKFVALGHRYRHSALAKSCMYNFPLLDEAKMAAMLADVEFSPIAGTSFVLQPAPRHTTQPRVESTYTLSPTAPPGPLPRADTSHNLPKTHSSQALPSTSSAGFECVKSFAGLKDQLSGLKSPPPERATKHDQIEDPAVTHHQKAEFRQSNQERSHSNKYNIATSMRPDFALGGYNAAQSGQPVVQPSRPEIVKITTGKNPVLQPSNTGISEIARGKKPIPRPIKTGLSEIARGKQPVVQPANPAVVVPIVPDLTKESSFDRRINACHSPAPSDKDPELLRTAESIFEKNPATKPGHEPFMLSRSCPLPDTQPTSVRVTSPSKIPQSPRRASELPVGMPYAHGIKLGLHPVPIFPTKLPTVNAQVAPDLVNGPLSTNFPILAAMLAEERTEGEYARYKCQQAELRASEAAGRSQKYASEAAMMKAEIDHLKGECRKWKETAEVFRERCDLWESNYVQVFGEHRDFLD